MQVILLNKNTQVLRDIVEKPSVLGVGRVFVMPKFIMKILLIYVLSAIILSCHANDCEFGDAKKNLVNAGEYRSIDTPKM